MEKMNLAAVTIANERVSWQLPIPHISYVEGYRDEWDEGLKPKSLERVKYLAERRNNAVREVLNCWPVTTDILMVDSYYCSQQKAINRLVYDYQRFSRNWILAGATWMRDYWPWKLTFWDTWTTPEGLAFERGWDAGFRRVKAAGGIMVFPVDAWKQHGFDASRFPQGSEINGFCENNSLETWLDLSAEFYHPRPRSRFKELRIAQGKYRRRILGR